MMKGLLYKDIVNLKQQGKVYLLILGLWIAVGIANKDAAFFGGVMSVFAVLIPLSAVAYDEKAKWDRYALTMPISRMDLVMSKYMLALLCTAAGSLLSAIVAVIITGDVVESLLQTLMFASLGMVFASVSLPPIFKFGVEKGRMVMISIALLPTIVILLGSNLHITAPSENTLKIVADLAPAIALVMTLASIQLSKAIYMKKEF